MQAYSRTIIRLTAKDCAADLGDAQCGIDLESITIPGTVDSVTGNRVIFDAVRTETDEWFTAGKLTFTSGLNEGLSMEVKQSVAGQITLHEKMPFAIAAGDTYTIYKGCTKRFAEDCLHKFGNTINFRGFPHLPGHSIYKVGGLS
jgi:uncharacterized phage protein (TIGR02218 family)